MQHQAESWIQAGTRFAVTMHWRLDAAKGIHAWGIFSAEVVRVDGHVRRLLCKLESLDQLSTSHPPSEIEPALIESITALVGKHANLPFEAVQGTNLNLRLETLTGPLTFFFDESSPKMKPTGS